MVSTRQENHLKYNNKFQNNSTDPSVSVFDLSGFDEEKTYFRAEPTLVCRSKESVQVTTRL